MELIAHLDLEEQNKNTLLATIDGMGDRNDKPMTREHRLVFIDKILYPHR